MISPKTTLGKISPLSLLIPISPQAERKRHEILNQVLERAFKQRHTSELSERNYEIFQRRYGLVNGNIENIRVLANKFELSPESVRRIEWNYLRRLEKLGRQALSQFLPFELDSFPQRFGATCPYDLDTIFPRVDFNRSKVGNLLNNKQIRRLDFLLEQKVDLEKMPLLDFFRKFKPQDLPTEISEYIFKAFYEISQVQRQ